MQDEVRNNNTYSGGPLSGLFRNCGCNNNNGIGGDSTILFFLIVFLLLFTNFGCCNILTPKDRTFGVNFKFILKNEQDIKQANEVGKKYKANILYLFLFYHCTY